LGQPINVADDTMNLLNYGADDIDSDFDVQYGLLQPEETFLIRAYSDDTDDRLLGEIRPKFIVMFEPDTDLVRRIEVCWPLPSTYP
jgi:DNA excision repair protein ERCC-4